MITKLKENQIFVFGSNLAGRHGAGAARYAHDHFWADMGCWVGLTGKCYAIPTKDKKLRTLPLSRIRFFVEDFLEYAKANPKKEFLVTEIGTGLAGYEPLDIAPFFKGYTSNVKLPKSFLDILVNDK